MIVSPTNVSVPLIAPSVNVQTEQTARDNKVREPVTPASAVVKTSAERRIKGDEKRQRHSSWEPAESSDCETDPEVDTCDSEGSAEALERLFGLLALQSYSDEQGKGYTIRFRLPKRILDAAIYQGLMERRRTVIKFHYGHSVAPHTPSEVIAVL